MALVSLVDDPHLNIDKGHAYAVLLWDLAAAFDTVDHANLLSHFVAEVNFRRWALEQFKVLLDKKKMLLYTSYHQCGTYPRGMQRV